MYDTEATIVALATAKGGGLRGVVRMAGPRAAEILQDVFRPCDATERLVGGSARILFGEVDAGCTLGWVPVELYFWPDSRSYTRQPAAELHTLGSPPVLDGILESLSAAGARLALPGEFTLRAFLSGRLDLTQAEAVLGVIEARSQGELSVALQQLAGGLARPLHALRDHLLDLLAHLEAGLDFVEEDIEFITAEQLVAELATAEVQVRELVEQMVARGESVAEPRVVLRGLPNAGKSSLFNALLQSSQSIVSEIASTTRDFVTARWELSPGRTVTLVDTAGVEFDSTAGSIAGFAQRQGQEQGEQADLQLFCLDVTRSATDWEREQIEQAPLVPRLIVLTKCDQPATAEASIGLQPGACLMTSSQTGVGLRELRAAIATALDAQPRTEGSMVATTAARCQESLRLAAESLARARVLAATGAGEELVAAEIRVALDQLGTVAGVVYTDDILDRVFSRFCIGK